MASAEERRAVAVPAFVLGAGLGAVLDVVVLHDVLGWHHLLSSAERSASTPIGSRPEVRADGLFELAALALAVVGVAMLWSRASRAPHVTWRSLTGWAVAGWGTFNAVDGIVAHAVLGLHHAREGPGASAYDAAFLVGAAGLVAAGALLARSDRGRPRRISRHAETVVRPPGRHLDVEELRRVASEVAARPDVWRPLVDVGSGDDGEYRAVYEDEHLGVCAISWTRPEHDTGFHDHDRSRGAVCVAEGAIAHEVLTWSGPPIETVVSRGGTFVFLDEIHRMRHASGGRCVTIHAYSPPPTRMGRYGDGDDGRLLRRSGPWDERVRAQWSATVEPGRPFRR